MNYYDGYEYYGTSGLETAIVLGILFFSFTFGLILYVINSIFLMKLLKNAGHKTPFAAWIPLWNTVTLMEIGGIKQPWIWALIFVLGSVIGGSIPVLGIILSLAVMVAAIIVTVYLAKGVQAGLGINSVGGIVLAVLLPVIWVIWMAVASGKVQQYNVGAAIAEGSSMPINWFGNSDLYAPFGYSAPAQQYAGQQPQGGYRAAQAGAPYGQATDPYSAPQQHADSYGQAPYSAPTAQSDWNLSPEQRLFNAPTENTREEPTQNYGAPTEPAATESPAAESAEPKTPDVEAPQAQSFPSQFSSTPEAPASAPSWDALAEPATEAPAEEASAAPVAPSSSSWTPEQATPSSEDAPLAPADADSADTRSDEENGKPEAPRLS